MSQRQQDRAVLDIIENILKPEEVEELWNEDGRDEIASLPHRVIGAFAWLIGVGLLLLWFYGQPQLWPFSWVYLGNLPSVSNPTLVFALALIFLGRMLDKESITRRNAIAARKVAYTNHRLGLQTLRAQQRGELLQHLTSADVARAMANSQYGAQDLEHMWRKMEMDNSNKEAGRVRGHESSEAERNRTHQASESAKDRKLSTKQLLAKYKQELDVLEKRVRSAPDVTADELAAFELEKAAMDAIDREPDEDKKERMIRRLDKRLYR